MIYQLTGGEALQGTEVAKLVSEITGRSFTFTALTAQDLSNKLPASDSTWKLAQSPLYYYSIFFLIFFFQFLNVFF